MSHGALSWMTALLRWPASREPISSMARSSRRPRMRRPSFGAFAHLGRIGPQEERRHRDDLVAPDAVVDGQVVSLHPPAPRIGPAGIPEDGPVVQLRIADECNLPPFDFQRPQHVLVLNDETGLLVRLVGQAGRQQLHGQLALVFVHIAQGQTVPVQRRVVPEDALAVQVVIGSLAPLLVVQARQPAARCVHHGGGHVGVGMRVPTSRHVR